MKFRTVLCEDNEHVREVMHFVLEERGHEVHSFRDAGECPLHSHDKCKCESLNPCSDFIISDVSMPKISGLEFAKKLKEIGCKVGNVALVSGYWTDEDIKEAEGYGCTVVHKPLNPADLDSWLAESENSINPKRVLPDWDLHHRNE